MCDFNEDETLVVKKDAKWGVVDINGDELIPYEYENIQRNFDGYFEATKK